MKFVGYFILISVIIVVLLLFGGDIISALQQFFAHVFIG